MEARPLPQVGHPEPGLGVLEGASPVLLVLLVLLATRQQGPTLGVRPLGGWCTLLD